MNTSEREDNADEGEQAQVNRRPRSAVTSGRRLLIGGDPNSAWSRRYRDLVTRHIGDLGGPDQLSEAQLSLVRRAAALACELESQEARMSQGVQVNLDSFGRAASHLRRIYESLGLKRQQRDVTPGSALSAVWEIEGRPDVTEAEDSK
jgi:hypothetical protein